MERWVRDSHHLDTLPPIDGSRWLEIMPTADIGYAALVEVLFTSMPNRSVLGATLMITQSFLSHAIVFTYPLVPTTVYGDAQGSGPVHVMAFAAGTLLGPADDGARVRRDRPAAHDRRHVPHLGGAAGRHVPAVPRAGFGALGRTSRCLRADPSGSSASRRPDHPTTCRSSPSVTGPARCAGPRRDAKSCPPGTGAVSTRADRSGGPENVGCLVHLWGEDVFGRPGSPARTRQLTS